VVIFLSKYFSSANENKNKEKTDIKIDGIKVNKEKKVIYFLFALDPSIGISFLIEFLISKKIIEKKTSNNKMFDINKYCKFLSVSSIKLLSIKVKKVKKPKNSVIMNIIIIKIFFLINLSIIM
tara:strand:- start:31 stop:399 length:369 start_codon:yes stop_codon:yes gene_type:complete